MESPISPQLFVMIAILPALIVLLVGAVSWQVWRARFTCGSWGGPVAVAAAFAFAFPHITGSRPGWPVHETTTWIFYIAIVAGLVGLLDALVRLPVLIRCNLAYAVCFASMAILLKYKLTNEQLTRPQYYAMTSSLAIIGLLWWAAFERSSIIDERFNAPAEPKRSIMMPLLMWITSTAAAIAFMCNGGLKFGQFGMSLAGISGALAVVSLLRPNIRWGRGTAFAFCPVMLSVIVAAQHLIPLERIQIVKVSFPLMAVPIFILLGRLISVPVDRPKLRTAIRVATLALPMIAVIILAILSFQAEEKRKKESGEDMYGTAQPIIVDCIA